MSTGVLDKRDEFSRRYLASAGTSSDSAAPLKFFLVMVGLISSSRFMTVRRSVRGGWPASRGTLGCVPKTSESPNDNESWAKLRGGRQVGAEVQVDNRYDHKQSPEHPTCRDRDRDTYRANRSGRLSRSILGIEPGVG